MEMLDLLESEQKFDQVDDDDEIYEQIEAPKYVDLTRPDQYLPDDRSWFCLRIGCDQNHEDVDPVALQKSFVLRVMAARSPNLRLRKALRSRQVPSAYMNYPMSAPAKPSKPRVCRFTTMTSISQKMADNKVKVRSVSKINLTPAVKQKESSSAAKFLTTPRVKKSIQSSDHFRSVQNPKRSDAVAKSKVVAKTLVFNSPPKSESSKRLFETETPMTEICDGMKMLQINSQRKKLSWNSGKSSKCTVSRHEKSRAASDPSTSELYTQKLKSGDREAQEVISSKCTMTTITKNPPKFSCPRPHSLAKSDVEIDGDAKIGSIGFCSGSEISGTNEGNRNEEQSDFVATATQVECLPSSKTFSLDENVGLTDVSSYLNASEKDPLNLQLPNVDGGIEVIKGDEHGRGIDLNVSEEGHNSVGVSNARGICDTPKEINMNTVLSESETPLTEICDGLKKLEINSQRKKPAWNSRKSSRCTASRPKSSRTTSDPSTSKLYSQKLKSRVKDSKDHKDQGVKPSKYTKMANTNDSTKCSQIGGESSNGSLGLCSLSGTCQSNEHSKNEGIEVGGKGDQLKRELDIKVLEEGDDSIGVTNASGLEDDLALGTSDNAAGLLNGVINIEDKENVEAAHDNRNNLQSVAHENQQKGKALKGNSTVGSTSSLLGKCKKTKPTNPKPFRLRTDERGILREANLEKKHLPAPLKEMVPVSDKPKQKILPQQTKSTCHQTMSASTGKEAQKPKPQLLRQQLRTQRENGTKKTPVSRIASRRLSVIMENSSAILRTKDTRSKSKGAFIGAGRPARGKNPATIPKEPNFHSIHTPKSCTKKAADTIHTPKSCTKTLAEVIAS